MCPFSSSFPILFPEKTNVTQHFSSGFSLEISFQWKILSILIFQLPQKCCGFQMLFSSPFFFPKFQRGTPNCFLSPCIRMPTGISKETYLIILIIPHTKHQHICFSHSIPFQFKILPATQLPKLESHLSSLIFCI